MSRPIRYRRTFDLPAPKVYAAMVDREHLEARLRAMGGANAVLLDYELTDNGARFRLQHGLEEADLPPLARTFVPSNQVIERTEVWRVDAPGRYTGEVQVLMPGMPASVDGGQALADSGAGDSELRIDAQVSVGVPLIGGKIEEIIADQVVALLAAETGFTERWLAG